VNTALSAIRSRNAKRRRTVVFPTLIASLTGLLAATSAGAAAPFDTVVAASVEQIVSDIGYKTEASKAAPIMLGQVLDDAKRGGANPQPMELKCGAMSVWHVIGEEHDEAYLYVGLCDRRTEVTPEALARARAAQSQTIEVLARSIPRENAAMFRGLEPQIGSLDKDLESEYLNVVLVGHGAWILPTLVVTAPGVEHALVLQLFANSCLANNYHPKPRSPMCAGQKDWLERLALKIVRDLPLK
jgi:hypothetical protein